MLSSREAKELRALQSRRGRARSHRFLAEGVRLVEDLLESPIPVHWALWSSSLEDSPRAAVLRRALEAAGVPLRDVAPAEFHRVAGTDAPQGVLAVAEAPDARLESLPSDADTLLLVLDAVQDPGNFGTLVRSAEALGAAGVIALPGTVDPWNPKAVRAAMGSSFRVPIVEASWPESRDWLRARDFTVLAAAAGGLPLPRVPGAIALVVGNEGAGVSAAVRADADAVVGVRLRGRAESLNVAAAAAILLHELSTRT